MSRFSNVSTLSATVVPCCNCDRTLPSDTSLPTELPCRAQPAQLVGSYWSVEIEGWGSYNEQGAFSTLIFESELVANSSFSSPVDPIIQPYEVLTQPSTNNAFQNVFQSRYHLARLELGIIVENQIFNSPVMFNESISTVPEILANTLGASDSRKSTSNTTLMNEWADTVRLFSTTDRVPLVSYLRPVPRLKPLGTSLTSVFVSTFAMVSVLWTVFSLVVGIIAARSENASTQGPTPSTVEDRLDTHDIAIARMQLALKKRGLFEDDDEEGDLEASIACTSESDNVQGQRTLKYSALYR
ncbi:hypothetical protein C8R46DRAFT_1035489 [Mycena filopes]|nr:hypothetical protein C8R46DRAFT_1035489 [Mycena filopes]